MASEPPRELDLAGLYPQLSPQLRRVLGRNLQAPEWVLEDACQIAWEALLRCAEPVQPEHVLGWLATTARREALALLRRAGAELSLEAEPVAAAVRGTVPRSGIADPYRAAVCRDRLATLAALPRRERRALWMRGLGFGYAEISAYTGDSPRTVARQLTGARRRLAGQPGSDAA